MVRFRVSMILKPVSQALVHEVPYQRARLGVLSQVVIPPFDPLPNNLLLVRHRLIDRLEYLLQLNSLLVWTLRAVSDLILGQCHLARYLLEIIV